MNPLILELLQHKSRLHLTKAELNRLLVAPEKVKDISQGIPMERTGLY
jgi:hypothetical protein